MKFTKLFGTVGAFLLLSAGALAGTLKVGATPVPHAEILELIKPDLKKEGVDLKIVEFTDYVTPNLALSDKEIDANFFQHKPYLDKFAEERKLNLVSYLKHVSSYSYDERVRELELNPDRADVITHATRIYINAMKWSKAKHILVPRVGLSDGIVRKIYTSLY